MILFWEFTPQMNSQDNVRMYINMYKVSHWSVPGKSRKLNNLKPEGNWLMDDDR